MYRIKDFFYKTVYDIKGKQLGSVRDICIDFYKGKVNGLLIGGEIFKSKKNYIPVDSVINVDDDILVESCIHGEGLNISDILGMEVIDRCGTIKGVVEDILISEDDYYIKGIIISAGIIDKLIYGREVILINKSVLGEDYILYLGDPNLIVKNIPHEMNRNEYYKKA